MHDEFIKLDFIIFYKVIGINYLTRHGEDQLCDKGPGVGWGNCIPLRMALEIHLRSGQIMDIVIGKVWISKFTLFFSDGLALDRFIEFSQKQTAD